MNIKRFPLFALAVLFIFALSLTSILAQESTETPDTEATETAEIEATASADAEATEAANTEVMTTATCDIDLILSLYTAQRFLGFDSFNSQLSSDTMLDIDSIDKGQYATLFENLSTSDDFEMTEARRSSMMDMQMMSDADFDAHMNTMSASSMATTNVLRDGFANESQECAALRHTLRRFYLSLALSDSDMSSSANASDTDSSTTDSSAEGEEAAAGTLAVNLSGATEVPGPGDEDASGTATVYLRTETNEVCVDLTIQNISLPATAAHIHQAPAGESGPPVVTLNTPSDAGLSSTCATIDAALMQEMVNNPQNFYINIHNGEFPDGAARGQLQ